MLVSSDDPVPDPIESIYFSKRRAILFFSSFSEDGLADPDLASGVEKSEKRVLKRPSRPPFGAADLRRFKKSSFRYFFSVSEIRPFPRDVIMSVIISF